jgi:photosystem II stability/assembly factor-like uncharacterized protein
VESEFNQGTAMTNQHCLILQAVLLLNLFSGSLSAQVKEKIEIDDNTNRVVVSPWQKIAVDTDASFRGLHVVNDDVIWASGTKGTVMLSTDGGKTWLNRKVEGAEALDFRDVHGFDDGNAVIISSGDVARIYRTTNGGRTWKPCGEKKGAFFDAISFWNETHGILMSDPIESKIWIARTRDGGQTWKSIHESLLPTVQPGEAGFAASGTNMCVVGESHCFIGLGGTPEGETKTNSRILITDDRGETWQFGGPVPIARNPSSGIFSVWFSADFAGVAVGGDYLKPDDASSNYAVTSDGGKTWTTPATRVPPSGFRSCVAAWKNGREIKLVTVGPNGTDMSTDMGNKWIRISNFGFNSVGFSTSGRTGFAVGKDGAFAKWVLPR